MGIIISHFREVEEHKKRAASGGRTGFEGRKRRPMITSTILILLTVSTPEEFGFRRRGFDSPRP